MAATTRRRGWIRVGIVAAIFWVVGWSTVYWMGHTQIQVQLAELDRVALEVRRDPANPVVSDLYWREQTRAVRALNDGTAMTNVAVWWGAGVPVLLLILAPFAWFIYRGFKPRERKDT